MELTTNKAPLDWFTVGHFAVGLFFGQWFTPGEVGAGMTVFELTEAWQKDVIPQLSPHPGQDAVANSVTDVAAAMGGALVVRRSMRAQGLMDEAGNKIGPPPPPFTPKAAAVIGAKLALFGGMLYYGIKRHADSAVDGSSAI